jgi:hypothetical protein
MALKIFTEIFETRSSPHAKTLRTSFLDKIESTFGIIFGRPNRFYGLFDFMTLGLFLLILVLGLSSFDLLRSPLGFLAPLVIVPLIIINIPLLAVRFLVSFILTVIASPIVFLVNFVAKIIAQNELKLIADEISKHEPNVEFSIEAQKNENSFTYTLYTLTNRIENRESKVPVIYVGIKSPPHISITVTSQNEVTNGHENKKLFQALFKLNFHNVLKKLEKSKNIDLEENIELLLNQPS